MTRMADSSIEEITRRSLDILETLIGIDTTSRTSNIELIDYVAVELEKQGINSAILPNADGDKANLLARIGPETVDGAVLSGHTDVVPVDGQQWHSDPFSLVRRGNRVHGRGVADMKTFLAVAMASVPLFSTPHRLKRPIQLAFSYDEEIGCIGAPALIEKLVRSGPTPGIVIVGEPSMMKVIGTHKGTTSYRVGVRGAEAHSSQTHLGLSANMVAVHLMGMLAALAEDLRQAHLRDGAFLPDHSTLTIGTVSGGTAINILAGHCEFAFDLRFLPGSDPDEILAPFLREVRRIDTEIGQRFPGAGVVATRQIAVPALRRDAGGDGARIVASLAGDNAEPRADSFGSEAGQFQQAGLATVVCGPGSIAQAHQPDEYIEIDQIARCAAFMIRLAEHLGTG